MEEEQITGTETNEQEIEEPVQEEEQFEETQVTEDYQEFYSEQLELTNHLLAGQIFFLGVIFGVLLFKVFWDRWKV